MVIYAVAAALIVLLAARLAADRIALRFHLRVGVLSTFLPGWRQIGCGRCGTSWRYVRPHATPMQLAATGQRFAMAPLCDACWREAGSPGARIVFYEHEYWMRVANGEPLTALHRTAMRAAVTAGL